MGDIIIAGFADSAKVPGFYGETKFGQSAIKLSSISLKCLVVGLKATSGGNIALDSEARRILSKDDADTAFGAGSEAARMCYAALDETRGMGGFELYGASPTAAGGAAAATLTITVTGTSTAAGTIKVWVGGDLVEVNIANGTAQNAIATAINTALGQYPRLPASSGVATNVVTLTHKSAGIRGNQLICYVDFSQAPGVTLALGGPGSAVTSSTTLLGRTFGGGTGTETLTNLLAALYPTWFDFVAIAQNDATSLAAWESQVDAKAAPTEGRTEHVVVASGGTFGAATSLAQTTLNNHRFGLLWLENSDRHPSELAASFACLRAALEGTTPNKSYDGYALRVAMPQRFPADWVTSYSEKQAALDVGVTPLESRSDGKVYMVRAITTRCLDGSTPDYRTLDTSESFVPDYVRKRLSVVWTSEFLPANPYVRPDPVSGEPDVPAGVATPSLWNARIAKELTEMERERILAQTTQNAPSSEYNYVANRIMSAVPVVPLPHQHQVGVSVRQLNVSEG